jgi:hypothetical protein
MSQERVVGHAWSQAYRNKAIGHKQVRRMNREDKIAPNGSAGRLHTSVG